MFSQLHRNTNLSDNTYNPGPGYYSQEFESVQDRQKNQLQQKSDGLGKFNRQERFYEEQETNDINGPGRYKSQDYWEQIAKQKEKKQIQSNQSKFKINAIPSIPSTHQNLGYQEIGEGLLIQIKDNNQDKAGNIAPNAYNPKYQVKQKRAISYSFGQAKKETDDENAIQQQSQQFQPPDIQFLPKKIQEMDSLEYGQYKKQIDNENQNNKKYIDKKKNPFDKVKHHQPRLSNPTVQDNKDITEKDENLELLVIRDKMKERNNQGPGYVDPTVYSSFKNAQKNRFGLGNNGFNVLSKRFDNKAEEHQKIVGPSTYNIQRQRTNTISYQFPKDDKNKAVYKTDQYIPPVGYYEPKVDTKPKFKESTAEYKSVFGSGRNRFIESKQEKFLKSNPGPGEYNCEIKRKKKKVYKFISNSQLPLKKELNVQKNKENIQNQLFYQWQQQQQIEEQHQQEEAQIQRQYLQAKRKRCTSQFASQTHRFGNENYERHPEKLNIGPGTYQQKADQFESKTFNQSAAHFMSNSLRKNPFCNNKMGVNGIGPGKYDFDINVVKQNVQKAKLTFS